jgi:hypothetical protein
MSEKDCMVDQLSSATRHVVEARRNVEIQRKLISSLRAGGRNTEDLEKTLLALLQSLTELESHLRVLSKSVQ